MKESELILQAKKGEAEAFGTLYDTYAPAIYRFVLFKVGTKSDAEDVTHQVFLKAWKSMKKYRDEGHPFSSWLYRIAQNTVIDHYRSNRSHANIDTLPEDTLSEMPGFEENVDRGLQVEFVRRAIRELDDTGQNVLLMKFVNDLSNKEISATLQKSEGAIRVIQHRALKQLKTILEKHAGNNHTTHKV
ncbi:MAG: sigma-70 family RNA polymerase sigma factor [Patescibacteria group bacterium]